MNAITPPKLRADERDHRDEGPDHRSGDRRDERVVGEKQRRPEIRRDPRRKRTREQDAADDIEPHGRPVHHEIMADRGAAWGREDAGEQRAAGLHRHVHGGMALHAASDALLGLRFRLREQARREEEAEEQDNDDDHQQPARQLGERELPAHENDENDAQLDHQVGRGDLEGHGGGEMGALCEDRARQSHGGVGAGGGRGAEQGGADDRARAIVGQEPAHLGMRDDRLHHGREGEAEDQRPQDLPAHGEGHGEGVQQGGADGHPPQNSFRAPAKKARRGPNCGAPTLTPVPSRIL